LYIDEFEVVRDYVQKQFNIEPTVESILFLIGIQELGLGLKEYDRDEKMDLINLGTLKVLSLLGYYEKTQYDRDFWPIYQQLENVEIPTGESQEDELKKGIVAYFIENEIIK
jgi:hypothetical protein